VAESKYYDYTNGRPIDLETDGCDLASWTRPGAGRLFARHPEGFPIFLPSDKLAPSDEYAEADPYSVEERIDNAFHTRRIELTVDLVRDAVSAIQGAPQILDLGCGQGHITEAIRRAVPGAEVAGLDYSVSAIAYAHGRFPKIDFAVGDAYDCPYSPSFFDVVVCNNLWEHVPDPLFLLSRIKRIVKPTGHLVISTPSRYRVGNLVRVLRGKSVRFLSRHHVTEYTVGQVKEQLAYGGFQVQRVLSRPIGGDLKTDLARAVFSAWVSFVGSHHQLEGTVFYLARQTAPSAE
jgi:2-polyprenyl-3-methyl-5-hydroxy-6-metoxy-1,4-benzoquinol methylase